MRDYFGKEANELVSKKLWLFDMDGTIYKEDNLFDGTLELLRWIEESEGKYVFITNNSSKSVVEYVEKTNRLGISANSSNFFTSSQATILFLKQNYPGTKIYCQGTKSLVNELKLAGIYVTEEIEKVEVVLVGYDTELTSEKLRKTCQILSTQDSVFIATNPDLACPVSFGFIPDCGSICKMITHATGREPLYIGKPEPIMVDIVRVKEHRLAEETVVVGDRLYTDIAAGLRAGVTAVCVLTGEATIEQINKGSIKPTFTFENVKQLQEQLIMA